MVVALFGRDGAITALDPSVLGDWKGLTNGSASGRICGYTHCVVTEVSIRWSKLCSCCPELAGGPKSEPSTSAGGGVRNRARI